MGCSDIACSLKVRSCFRSLAGIVEVLGSFAHFFALVPEALHVAQEFDAPVLQPDARESVVCAARCIPCGPVRPPEIVEGAIAVGIGPTLQELLQAPLPLEHPPPVLDL